MNKPDFQDFPRDCEIGSGWKGSLEIEGSNKLNWATLVKQPRCVERVILTDEKANLEKNFWTLNNDDTFPIEYLNSTCNMKIMISYFYSYPGDEIWGGQPAPPKCYEMNTKVNCEEATITKTDFTSIAITVIIICLTVVIVVVIIVKKQSGTCKTAEKPKEKKELNDLYGTYYHGVEYNTVNDNNPRYNEEGGDAVVTDANADYYQLASATDHKPRHNQNGGKNGATSPNGNRYYKL